MTDTPVSASRAPLEHGTVTACGTRSNELGHPDQHLTGQCRCLTHDAASPHGPISASTQGLIMGVAPTPAGCSAARTEPLHPNIGGGAAQFDQQAAGELGETG